MSAPLESKPRMCFEVEKVIGVSSCGNVRSYQVQWAPAWVSSLHLVGCEHLIHEFLQRKEKEHKVDVAQVTSPPSSFENSAPPCERGAIEVDSTGNQVVILEEDEHPLAEMPMQQKNETLDEQYDEFISAGGGASTLDRSKTDISAIDSRTSDVFVKEEEGQSAGFEEPSHDESNFHLTFSSTHSSKQVGYSETVDESPTFVSNLYTSHPFSSNDKPDSSQEELSTNHDELPQVQHEKHQPPVETNPDLLCTVCNKQFHYRSKFNRHMRTHTGVKPFSCPECNRAFSRRDHLKDHLLIHSGKKPYVCEVCNKRFAKTGNLNSHMRTHGVQNMFACHVCSKVFSSTLMVVEHMKVHHGDGVG